MEKANQTMSNIRPQRLLLLLLNNNNNHHNHSDSHSHSNSNSNNDNNSNTNSSSNSNNNNKTKQAHDSSAASNSSTHGFLAFSEPAPARVDVAEATYEEQEHQRQTRCGGQNRRDEVAQPTREEGKKFLVLAGDAGALRSALRQSRSTAT